MKKILLFTSLMIFVFASCSDDKQEDDTRFPVDTALKLKAEKMVIEPFEKLKIRIDLDLDLIYETYDSLSWQANGVFWNGIIIIGGGQEADERDSYFTDYELGEHEITLSGFKDGKLLSKASIQYKVESPKGDFMNIKWGKETGSTSSDYLGNYTPLKIIEEDGWYKREWIVFSLYRSYTSSYPEEEYATMGFTPWSSSSNVKTLGRGLVDLPHVNEVEWHDRSHEGDRKRKEFEYSFLLAYMTELYGKPSFLNGETIPSKTNLYDEYSKRVSVDISKHGYKHPVAIWDTSTSHIVLTQAEDFIGGELLPSVCKIIAVPRK